MKSKKLKPRKTKKMKVKKNKTRGGSQAYYANHENGNGNNGNNGNRNWGQNRGYRGQANWGQANWGQASQGNENWGQGNGNQGQANWGQGNENWGQANWGQANQGNENWGQGNGNQGQANWGQANQGNENWEQANGNQGNNLIEEPIYRRANGRWNGNNQNAPNRNNSVNGNNVNGNNVNGNNYVYDGDDEDSDSDDDVEQDYDIYADYIEELTEGLDIGCTSSTLEEKLYWVNEEIERVVDDYETLVNGIALQTLGDFLETGIVKSVDSVWYPNAVNRSTQFQRISEEDLKHAFLHLLPSFDSSKKYMVLDENDRNTAMHDMIKFYAYKMITALFTRSNITYAVIQYDKTPSEHRFLENLLGVMRSASRITNQYLVEDWSTFLEVPMDRAKYVHSGGNMTVMIAGMLCYLYDRWNSDYQYAYEDTLLDRIRQDFDAQLIYHQGTVDVFYRYLNGQMANEVFRNTIKKNTEKISDLDLIFMAPDYFVDHIKNPYMFQINELSAYVLRRIMVAAHRDDGSRESLDAFTLMPFAGKFKKPWKRFMFSNMSEITPETNAGMRELHEKDYYGYRQSSNLVEKVPMYLNRIKQGYQPFFDLDLSRIPPNLQYEYSNKYGECIDYSMGARTNDLYLHKQENYKTGNYYTLDTIVYELNSILAEPPDDKTQKRIDRRDFLESINNLPINVLFQTIGRHIT
jgi:hypothetical protein